VVVVVVVVGAAVVVVGAGDAAACAGTITDLTTGFTHWSGKTRALAAPPPSAARKICRRSVVIVEPSAGAKVIIAEPESNRAGPILTGDPLLPLAVGRAGQVREDPAVYLIQPRRALLCKAPSCLVGQSIGVSPAPPTDFTTGQRVSGTPVCQSEHRAPT
jgi:hypothetical protein